MLELELGRGPEFVLGLEFVPAGGDFGRKTGSVRIVGRTRVARRAFALAHDARKS